MSELWWTAEGIERAEACGGVTLETYRRPGFTGGPAIRRPDGYGGGSGVPLSSDPWWDYEDSAGRRLQVPNRHTAKGPKHNS